MRHFRPVHGAAAAAAGRLAELAAPAQRGELGDPSFRHAYVQNCSRHELRGKAQFCARSSRCCGRRPPRAVARLGAVGTLERAALDEHRSIMAAEPTLSSLNPSVRVVTYNVLSSHLCEPTHYGVRARGPRPAGRPAWRSAAAHRRGRGALPAGALRRVGGAPSRTSRSAVHGRLRAVRPQVQRVHGRRARVALARYERKPSTSRAADTVALAGGAGEGGGGGGVLGSIQSRWRRSSAGRRAPGAARAVDRGRAPPERPSVGEAAVQAERAAVRGDDLPAVLLRLGQEVPGDDPRGDRRVLRQAFANGVPYVLAGDFNFKPDSAQYALVTRGGSPPTTRRRAPRRGAWAPCAARRRPLGVRDQGRRRARVCRPAFSSWSKEPFGGCLTTSS